MQIDVGGNKMHVVDRDQVSCMVDYVHVYDTVRVRVQARPMKGCIIAKGGGRTIHIPISMLLCVDSMYVISPCK